VSQKTFTLPIIVVADSKKTYMAAATAVADRNLKPYCEDILVWC